MNMRIISRLAARVKESSRHRWPWIVLLVVLLVSGVMSFISGVFRWEHGIAHILLTLPAWFGGPRGRAWSKMAILFWSVGILYEHFQWFTSLRIEPVHVADLYETELRWFGVDTGAGPVTPPEWFAARHHPALDLLTGLAYILYLYQPFLVFIGWFFIHPARARRLAWAFFAVNLLGMITYLLYPAAPPWYVSEFGPGPAQPDAAPSTAGAARFDALTGIPYFENFYARSKNVFGAMPSLHAAYPLTVFLCARGLGRAWSFWTLAFAMLVGFAAVYLQHHYLIDVLMGYVYAGISVGIVSVVERRIRFNTARPDPPWPESGPQTCRPDRT